MRSAAVAALVVVVASATGARADCAAAEPRLLWSAPAAGDVDVPANAKLVFIATTPIDVTVDGRAPVRSDVFQVHDPGLLEPGAHEVVVTALDDATQERIELARFTFESVVDTVPVPEAGPDVARVTATSERELSALCADVVQTFDCFDTGQDTHFVADLADGAGAGAARDAFLLRATSRDGGRFQQNVWPAECGDPEAFLSASSDVCLEVARIGTDGVSAFGRRACVGDVSCAQVSGSAPLLALLGLLAGGLARRHRGARVASSTP